MIFPRIFCGGTSLAAAVTSISLQAPASAAEPSAPATSGIQVSSTDIASYAQVIHDGTNWTMIPRGAVIHATEKSFDRLGGRPVGNLVSWREFLAINQDWLAAEEVTLRQAEGSSRLHPRRLEFFSKQERMIIAVHRGSPIAVAAPR